jgi:hypothetical protein
MAELDQNAWVLEPEAPNLADLHRRIVVAKHAYLDITIKCATASSITNVFANVFFAVMQHILAHSRPPWLWLEQRRRARPCAYRSEVTDGQVINRFCITFLLPCLLRPFLRPLDPAPVQSKRRDWLR